ncbi:glutathione peroxidase [Paenibacillus pini]|uniref:Glutathione peroxidase n=1 Tax=Paenibacillus pini JCM 16418 TaxID=1236976 RepID=W7YVG9_9BACL|nr:glutathione peroxidase [Paenibacillus pini]GAF08566.1 glutathione peroxidase [Paenibacillus pini JCM 16418]
MSVYSFQAINIRGIEKSLEQYKGKVLLIVNTASKCGFTPQYSDLQKLYEKYKDQGFMVLGFPCNQFGGQEPGSNEDVDTFCQLNYGVSFPLFEKVDVRGESKHPLFAYLTQQAPYKGLDLNNSEAKMLNMFIEKEQPDLLPGDEIKWNFTKFLINREGEVVERFESPVGTLDLEPAVEAIL